MFGLGTPEILLITLAILILFGGKKLPEMLGGLGKGIRNFKKNLNASEEDDPKKIDSTQDKPQP